MGLLCASADAVLVGSGTVEAVSHNIYPQAADLYVQYRQTVLGKAKHPLIVIVSGTGRIDLTRAVFHTTGITVLVLTTETGLLQLTETGADALSSTVIRVVPASEDRLAPSARQLRIYVVDPTRLRVSPSRPTAPWKSQKTRFPHSPERRRFLVHKRGHSNRGETRDILIEA